MEVLSVKNLYYKYNEQDYVINDVTFSIEQGQFVSLVGHNGSGKSTVAKLLAGLLEPSKGDICLFGKKIDNSTMAEVRQNIALVFQNPDNQFIGSTVEDDIAFGLENHRVPSKDMPAIIEKYAKYVGMYEFLNKEPTALSGGQKQRVAIAGALALNPKILILDESTSMLDPKGKKEIFGLIKKLKEENKELTVISITHDLEEAYSSDRVILFSNGKIVLDGAPQEIFKDEIVLEINRLTQPFALKLKKSLSQKGITLQGNTTKDLLNEICLLK